MNSLKIEIDMKIVRTIFKPNIMCFPDALCIFQIMGKHCYSTNLAYISFRQTGIKLVKKLDMKIGKIFKT